MSTVIVTGGAGFIGSNLIRHLLAHTDWQVVNVDKLTYAGNLSSLEGSEATGRYRFARIDIVDGPAIADLIAESRPRAILHLAAESHVDRSIDGPAEFIQTNVVGTCELLQASTAYWRSLPPDEATVFRFLHVSTDEVFGALSPEDTPFVESTPYAPRSPYAASKAASDHLVRAWGHTYGLPVVITNCSNNYGPYQFPEKLVPVVILKAQRGEPIPVYGRGENIRDWLHVGDHASAIRAVLERGRIGETYLISGNAERRNIDLVREVCRILDELDPRPGDPSRESLITFVTDRPGHDFRYAIDASKLRDELGWEPRESLASGLRSTVAWYLENRAWWQPILDRKYGLERLGSSGDQASAQAKGGPK